MTSGPCCRRIPKSTPRQTLIVNFNAYAGSSLDLMVYTFTKTTNWMAFQHIKQDVLLQIGQIIEKHGAEIAFPTQTLHMAGDALAAMDTVQGAA